MGPDEFVVIWYDRSQQNGLIAVGWAAAKERAVAKAQAQRESKQAKAQARAEWKKDKAQKTKALKGPSKGEQQQHTLQQQHQQQMTVEHVKADVVRALHVYPERLLLVVVHHAKMLQPAIDQICTFFRE